MSNELVVNWDGFDEKVCQHILRSLTEKGADTDIKEYGEKKAASRKKMELIQHFNKLVRAQLPRNINANTWSLEQLTSAILTNAGVSNDTLDSINLTQFYAKETKALLLRLNVYDEPSTLYGLLGNHVLFLLWIKRYMERHPNRVREIEDYVNFNFR